MKAQHERFGVKGKEAIPPDSEESAVKTSSLPPGLFIAVTMSDDEDESYDHDQPVSESDTNDVSAWAMMEHYHLAKDVGSENGNQQILLASEQETQSGVDRSSDHDVSSSFQSSDTEHSTSQVIFAHLQQPSWHHNNVKQIAALQAPAKVEWHENESLELVETSHYAHHSGSEISVFDDQNTMVDSPPGLNSGQSDQSLTHDSAFVGTEPTPARVRLEWQKESQLQDEASTTHASVLQGSLIQSDCQPGCEQASQQDSDTWQSVSSLVASEIGTPNPAEFDSKENTKIQLKKVGHSFGYRAKIEELEQNLKAQRLSTDRVQSKLKVRVVELEQALRSTAATPRGTIVQENPLKTLLDRNQTLVKEVRFADQTCVELSSRISALEAENKLLNDQVQGLEEDNNALWQENRKLTGKYDQTPLEEGPGPTECERDFQSNQGNEHTDASTSLSSDILSVEVSKTRSENDFLGRQLGIVQEKLDLKVKELDDERHRFVCREEEWEKENEKHGLKIQALEKVAEQVYLYGNDLSASHQVDSDKRVLELEKDIADAKANIVAVKLEAEKIRLEKATSPIDSLTLQTVQEVLSKIHERYQSLEKHVQGTVDSYIGRLDRLTTTVEYLRSSLVFEAESTISKLQNEVGQKDMDASIGSSPHSLREDELLSLMEEARSPSTSHSIGSAEISSASENISQLFHDDETLGSLTKNGSVQTYVTSDRWREPLDAAIKECQRVKERSLMLRQEIDKLKASIHTLEVENGKLSLEASRKGEEKRMVEMALDEAKQIIDEVHSKLQSTEEEREDALESSRDKEQQLQLQQASKQAIESDLRTEQAKQNVLQQRILKMNEDLAETKSRLAETSDSVAGHRAQYDDIAARVEKEVQQATAQRDAKILELEQHLKETENHVRGLEQSNLESTENLTFALDENKKYQRLTFDMEAQKGKYISEAEDSILESQCNLESIRRERAELRAQLSRKEQENASLKEAYTGYKKRAQIQMDQHSSTIQTLQSEQSDVFLHYEELKDSRKRLFDVLLSVNCCTDGICEIAASEKETPDDRKNAFIKELSYWRNIAPRVGETMQSLSKKKNDFDLLLKEAATLSGDLNLLKSSEKECKAQIEDERRQNEKFYSLLSQAELEMERSAKQIREMSDALSCLQQKEVEANEKAKSAENDSAKRANELQRVQVDLTNEQRHYQQKVSDLLGELEEKEARCDEMKAAL